MLSVVNLYEIMLNVVTLYEIMLNVVTLNAKMLNVVTLSAKMLSTITLSVMVSHNVTNGKSYGALKCNASQDLSSYHQDFIKEERGSFSYIRGRH
jgi:hypothetical protein